MDLAPTSVDHQCMKLNEQQPPFDGGLTIKQVVAKLQCSELTVRRYIAAARLRAMRVGPKAIRIDPASLANLVTPINA
jgi:excisionase family DNA binding protein